jgi:hypothetical protein
MEELTLNSFPSFSHSPPRYLHVSHVQVDDDKPEDDAPWFQDVLLSRDDNGTRHVLTRRERGLLTLADFPVEPDVESDDFEFVAEDEVEILRRQALMQQWYEETSSRLMDATEVDPAVTAAAK